MLMSVIVCVNSVAGVGIEWLYKKRSSLGLQSRAGIATCALQFSKNIQQLCCAALIMEAEGKPRDYACLIVRLSRDVSHAQQALQLICTGA